MKAALKEADELLPEPDPKDEMLPSQSAPLQGTPHPGYYREMVQLLHGMPQRRLQPKPPLWVEKIGDLVALKLYDTDIIRVSPDGTTIVSAGDWPTKLTMDFLNNYLPCGFSTYLLGKRLNWSEPSVSAQKRQQPLSNGDTIDSNAGILDVLAPAEFRSAR